MSKKRILFGVSWVLILAPFHAFYTRSISSEFIAFHGLITEVGLILILLSQRGSFSESDFLVVFSSFFFLLGADFLYNFEAIFPDWIHVLDPQKRVSETLYPAFVLTLSVYLFRRLKHLVIQKRFLLFFSIGAIFNGFLTAKYVLVPFYSRINPVPILYNVLGSTIYSGFSALVFGFVLLASLTVVRTWDFVFLVGLIFFQLSDISLRYISHLNSTPVFGWSDIGWNLGFAIVFFSLCRLKSKETLLDQRIFVSQIKSLRVLTAFSISAASLILLAGVGIVGSIHIGNIQKFSTALFLFFSIWSVSNYSALKISNAVEKIQQAMTQRISQLQSGMEQVEFLKLRKLEGLKTGLVEIDDLANHYNNLVVETNNLLEENYEQKKRKSLFEMATKVAHDIRSPLASLKSLESLSPYTKTEHTLLFRATVNRIEDIAKKLLDSNRNSFFFENLSSSEQINSNLRGIIQEKTLKCSSIIKIRVDLDAQVRKIRVPMDRTDFCSVVSNLIDNSLDSVGLVPGEIVVKTQSHGGFLELSVRDTGQGIPEEILPQIGKEGFTFGKSNGNGLGLFHARRWIEKMGGWMTLDSVFGQGTTVVLGIPIV